MSTTPISCIIGTSDPTAMLGIEVWLDNQELVNIEHFTQTAQSFTWNLDDSPSEHELKFVLKNKTADHTTIDESGTIVKDATITISNLAFEEIQLNQIIVDQSVYTHDYNGTGNLSEHKFYGTMGCNGAVSLKFTTPIYIWLLESL